jgi:hypothetical protein
MKKPSKEQLLQDVFSDMTWSDIAKKYNYSDSPGEAYNCPAISFQVKSI